MKLDYQYLLEGNLDPQSRVWIYQCNRLFSLSEAFEVEDILKQFTGSWLSHGTPVKGAAYLFFGQFVVLMADETASGVSGCSTDTSVRLIKDIEQRFGVTLFDRLSLAFVVKDKVELLPLSQLPYAAENGFINGDTLYFNNLVQTKKELETNWIIPVKESWLAKKIEFSGPVS
ncbi:MAG TPA: hypothetical protein PLU11_03310 [Chitinophagaceae bacterium]|nr:hypothetical protein [Chitinophagaceae bacterium]HPN58169.1 hypothetical protein [Chitinophagaceae bacterium]